ncbi:ABC transporter ATP-binding protein [Rhodohalobacter mucosus]|uniref:ATP-binding protein n=1 Tax=Rhodohalobacter mucosus TaxID=2079485 RepID=A0A316TS04_9BACT|nr:ABC transporter ATP-binding protein [Rhodohalobacter mucosus]PWN06411.1 ATP-binding protein [Rhodohalobacter mucosus]
MSNVVEAIDVNKYFREPVEFHVLKDINLTIESGEFVSIIGPSGSGKSTLLYVLSSLDRDYEGSVHIDGTELKTLTNHKLSTLRNKSIGFIFQFHYLLSDFTALDNVMLPGLKLGELSHEELEEKAMEKLDLLGIADQAGKKINLMSGGQQQRVSVARALINEPRIIFCDEPTGNLDSENASIVFDMLKKLTRSFDQTILMVTHDDTYSSKTDRQIRMLDGRIEK